MITTEKCVICFGKPKCFGGHVHKDGKSIIAGTCEEHCKQDCAHNDCKGCYGEWKEEMGYKDSNYNPNRKYGTDKSELLAGLITAGHNPIAITTMTCEETFVFNTEVEAHAAHAWVNLPDSQWKNEGWWYGLDGKYPWKQTWKDYVKKCYEGDESEASKIYWLNK